MNISVIGAELLHGDGRTKLIATSRRCTNAPTVPHVRPSRHGEHCNMRIAHDCGREVESNVQFIVLYERKESPVSDSAIDKKVLCQIAS
jgi:hypothetical protein